MSTQQKYQATLATLSLNDLELERDAAFANNDVQQLQLIVNELVRRQQVSGQQTQQPSFVLNKIKIEKPKAYSGNPADLSNFLFSVKQYLDTVGLIDEVGRQQFATTLLRGRAMTWWRTWVDRIPQLPSSLKFVDFEIELEKQFRDVDHVDRLRRKLSALRQTTSVARYIDVFRETIIELGNNKPDDDTVLFQFINGLKREVQLHVRLTQPKDLIAAELAAEQTDSALYLSHNKVSASFRSHPQSNSRGPVPMELGLTHQANPPRRTLTCYRCGKVGHIKRNCRVNLNRISAEGAGNRSGYGRGATNLRSAAVETEQPRSKN